MFFEQSNCKKYVAVETKITKMRNLVSLNFWKCAYVTYKKYWKYGETILKITQWNTVVRCGRGNITKQIGNILMMILLQCWKLNG